MKLNCILFDLDGTLLNTNRLVLESFKHTFRKHLKREVSDKELYPFFGVPLVTIMEHYDSNQVDEMLATYREYNLTRHDELTELFPEARETLDKLQEKGVTLGIVSSKIKGMVHRGLDLFALRNYFQTIVAFEDTEAHKPDAAPINKALQDLESIGGARVDKEQVLMVGDSPFDILCAINAGVKSAAVNWSLHEMEELKSHTPDVILTDFPELLKLTSG